MSRWAGLGAGVYQDTKSKKFYHRPVINGKTTFRLLDVATLTQARALKAKLDSDQTLCEQGLAKDPYAAPASTIGELIAGYKAAGCPMKNHQKREGIQLHYEENRLVKLEPFWGVRRADQVKPKDCMSYAESRRSKMREGLNGGRSIDMELITLTAVFNWAVFAGRLDSNPIVQRPKFRDGKKVRHCRDCMPQDGIELHKLASELFKEKRSEALGWQLLLEAMTGCRTSEILRLRWDAKNMSEAGFRDGNHLWLNRSKGGVNPWIEIHPALEQALNALVSWRAARGFNDCPWFIPSWGDKTQPADVTSLTHALARIGPVVAGAHRTSHGLRAFYVTVRRSMGIADVQIAGEIGDSSGAAIIVSTYGAVPPNWKGGAALGWMVEKPAWLTLDIPQNVLQIGSARG